MWSRGNAVLGFDSHSELNYFSVCTKLKIFPVKIEMLDFRLFSYWLFAQLPLILLLKGERVESYQVFPNFGSIPINITAKSSQKFFRT